MAALKTIQADLAAISPVTATALQLVIDQIEADIRDQFASLVRSSPMDFAARSLLLEFDKALSEIEKYRLKVSPALDAELRSFSDLIHKWRVTVAALLSEISQNARTQFSDKGAWAMHFSVVRMTITTFLIGISWTVISLKWDDYTPPLGFAAIGVWGMAGLFLWIFTKATCDASRAQKKIKDSFLTAEMLMEKRGFNPKIRTLIWVPVYLYLLLSLGFLGLCCSWKHHVPDKKITWAALVEPESLPSEFTNETKKSSLKFHTPEHLSLGTNLEYWAGEIQKYTLAISTNHSSNVSPDLSALATNLNLIGDQLQRIADTNSLFSKQSPAQIVTQTVDTTRIESALSNIVTTISNLANSMPKNVPATNIVQVKVRNIGFLKVDGAQVETK